VRSVFVVADVAAMNLVSAARHCHLAFILKLGAVVHFFLY
jgi:hypothetical protein